MLTRTYAAKSSGSALFVTECDVAELSRGVALSPANLRNDKYTRIESGAAGDADWYGGLTHTQQVLDLLAKGWQTGAKRLAGLGRELENEVPAAKSRRRRPVWADDGDSLDEDKALSGQWDTAYRSARRQLTSGSNVVELVAAWGGTGNWSSDEMFWSGAGMLVACDLLENAGYSVRLVAANFHKHDMGQNSLHRVVCKEPDESLNISALASVVCHVGTYRTLGFKLLASCPWNVTSTFGRTVSPHSIRGTLEAHGEWPADAIVLDNAYSRDMAVRNVRSVVERIQGTGRAA